MPDQVTTIFKRTTGWRRLKAFIGLVLLVLTGCFGPPTMHYDIQEYNKQVVSSEQQMLLYNIGRLNRKLPPHFMMLSTVSQTRMFSGSASFQWSQMWNSLFPGIPNKNLGGLAKGSNTWEAGPFTAGAMENPTIVFVPIQGQDFATRFESTLTDKFSLFTEDLWKSGSREQLADLFDLFAEDLELLHGDGDVCKQGVYSNRSFKPLDVRDPVRRYYVDEFSECVDQLMTKPRKLDYEQIDGDHSIPTTASEDPKAADLVTALQAGYKWAKQGKDFQLTNPARIMGWFDYSPTFTSPSKSKTPDSSLPVFWIGPPAAQKNWWKGLQYTLPKDYKWKVYKTNKNDPNSNEVYALVPEGYDLDRYSNGELKFDRNGNPILTKPEDKGPGPSKYVSFSYANRVVGEQWPFPYDMVYVEFRHNVVDDATAEKLCFDDPTNDSNRSGLVCGYFKIGNLLQIMQRLADNACDSKDPEEIEKYCSSSIFGVGPDVPSWADISAPFTDTDGTKQYVWVPAHDPAKEADLVVEDQKNQNLTPNKRHRNLADRDQTAFFTLYKLYQMSLVDTTKLVTGAPPITISK